MEIFSDSANFAVWVYLIMATKQICLRQSCGSGSSGLNSCPNLNKSGRGRAGEFPQWDPESCYGFGSGPDCPNPMTWLFFSVPAVFIVWFQTNAWSLLVHFKGVASKGGIWQPVRQVIWLFFFSSCKHSSCICVPASAQIVCVGCYHRSSAAPEPVINS